MENKRTLSMKKRLRSFLFPLLVSSVIFIGISCSEKSVINSEVVKENHYSDALDSIVDSSQLVIELKDIYRAFKIHYFIEEQKDFIAIDSIPLLVSYLESKVKECDSLQKLYSFNDDSLDILVNNYIVATISQYELEINSLRSPSPNDTVTSSNMSISYSNIQDKFLNYLFSNYKNERFLSVSSEDYWERIEKKQYIKSDKFKDYQRLKIENPDLAVDKIFDIINESDNFQEKSIYGIEVADFYMTDVLDTDTISGEEWAVAHYNAIMGANKYSLYLFEAWIKWRTVTQHAFYGSSKISLIPNDEYNKLRDKMALIVLKQISTHPKDQMAINQFLLFATHEDIKRFGSYKYGNQNVPEFYRLFAN